MMHRGLSVQVMECRPAATIRASRSQAGSSSGISCGSALPGRHRRSRREPFEAVAVVRAHPAGGDVGHQDVAHLRMRSAVQHASVDDRPTAHARPDREVHEVLVPAARTVTLFPDRRGGDIRGQHHRGIDPRGEFAQQIHA